MLMKVHKSLWASQTPIFNITTHHPPFYTFNISCKRPQCLTSLLLIQIQTSMCWCFSYRCRSGKRKSKASFESMSTKTLSHQTDNQQNWLLSLSLRCIEINWFCFSVLLAWASITVWVYGLYPWCTQFTQHTVYLYKLLVLSKFQISTLVFLQIQQHTGHCS